MALRIIAVFGATGAQGGSVLRELQQAGGFHIRALTRNANSDKSKQLAQLSNVSVVEADLNNEASVDAALKGADGVFLVTDFSAHLDHSEVPQGKRVVDSAIRNGVKQFVFSGLENAKRVIGRDVFHFDYKQEIEDYALAQTDKLNFTSIRLSAYTENLFTGFLRNVGDNQFVLGVPMKDKKMYIVSVDDIGGVALSVFQKPEEYKSKILPIASDYLTIDEYAAIIGKHFPQAKFTYQDVPTEVFEKFPFPGAVDLARMFDFFQTEKMERDIVLSKNVYKGLHNLEAYIEKNRAQILEKLNAPVPAHH